MPNERLNPIVLGVDEKGTVHYRFWASPHLIVDVGDRLRLMRPDYVLTGNEKLLAKGYRHCPTHWEWVLMLRPFSGTDFIRELRSEFANEASLIAEESAKYNSAPVFDIVLEENDWKSKGGSRRQVSVYLERSNEDPRKFSWAPSKIQLRRQIRLAFALYGWSGPTGLETEIFSRL